MILVVGGTGFIGKNLLLALHRQDRVTIVVSRQPDREFLSEHVPGIHALSVEQLLTDPAVALFDCQAVIYLASSSTPSSNLEAPWREAMQTVEPLMRLTRMVAKHSQAHFIYLSSGGAIYGPTKHNLISEDTPLNPISPYGLGKKMSESVIQYMAATHDLKHTILRPSNPIGRWQENRSQGVVGALIRAARDGTPFPMIGDGSAVRDYFDVADLAAAIIATMDAPERSVGQTWNVGSGQGYSVRDMLGMVREISGRDIEIKPLPARDSDVDRVVLDVSRIENIIGWRKTTSPQTSLNGIWNAETA